MVDQSLDHKLAFELRNDVGNAKRLIARHGNDMCFVPDVGWFYYSGKHWDASNGGTQVQLAAQATALAIMDEAEAHEDEKRIAAHKKFSVTSGNTPKISGMINQATPRLLRSIKEMDANSWLFNCENGTINLKNICGSDANPLRPHSRSDFITKKSNVIFDPEATCPLWRKFLDRILPNHELQNFIQRWYGYNLTGDTEAQCLVLLYGQGANGKSTLTEVLMSIMADYGLTLPFASLLHDDRRRGSEASPDLARLPGARMVVAAEAEVGARFSESLLKSLTGGDKLTVRHLHRGFFEFNPNFKLTLSCNSRPQVRGRDEGIWRRLMLVPFDQIIPPEERDKTLKQKLQEEASGILNWLLDGLRMYEEMGLNPPDAVRMATKSYREESDPVGQFIAACIMRVPGLQISAKSVFDAYRLWCNENAMQPVSHNAFGRAMTERRFERDKTGTIFYRDAQLVGEMQHKVDTQHNSGSYRE